MNFPTIASDDLEVRVAPGWGGKVVSVRHRSRDEELLFTRSGVAWDAPRADFGDWAFGWDDCWPSVTSGGPGFPDHGALWNTSARVVGIKPQELTLETVAPDGLWAYRKTLRISGETLEVEIDVENRDDRPREGFWTLHALVRVEDDLQLLFPGTDQRLTVFGPDFAPASLPPSGSAAKFWLPEPLSRGTAAVLYPRLGMEYRLEWDPSELPYLGLWVTNGGFRGERNLAWEPSDGFYDSVAEARSRGCLPVLGARSVRRYRVRLTWRNLRPRAPGRGSPSGPGRP